MRGDGERRPPTEVATVYRAAVTRTQSASKPPRLTYSPIQTPAAAAAATRKASVAWTSSTVTNNQGGGVGGGAAKGGGRAASARATTAAATGTGLASGCLSAHPRSASPHRPPHHAPASTLSESSVHAKGPQPSPDVGRLLEQYALTRTTSAKRPALFAELQNAARLAQEDRGDAEMRAREAEEALATATAELRELRKEATDRRRGGAMHRTRDRSSPTLSYPPRTVLSHLTSLHPPHPRSCHATPS